MAYMWPDKDKDELIDYNIDWSRFLSEDPVASAVWYIHDADDVKVSPNETDIVDGLQYAQSSISAGITTIRLGLGTNNKRYKITCAVTTTGGLVYERSVYLRIREK